MAVSMSVTKTVSLGGKSFNESKTISGEALLVHELSVSAGESGDLTTRTDADTGVVTLDDSGHAFVTGDKADVYWTAGCRRGMEVTVTGNEITVDGGEGDDLPSQDTEVTLCEPDELDITVDGDNVVGFVFQTAARGAFTLWDAGGLEFSREVGAGCNYIWHNVDGTPNPIEGDSIIKVRVSNGSTAAATMKVGFVYNNG